MTTAEIETLADIDKSGAPDFPTGTALRRKVIPEFFRGVGLVGWRRFQIEVPLEAGATYFDFSPHFRVIESIWCKGRQLTFIGDSNEKMAEVSNTNPPSDPYRYYLSYNAGEFANPAKVVEGINVRRCSFSAPVLDRCSAWVFGWMTPWFDDNTTPVLMDPFIPEDFQWGLVEGLRAEIFRTRFGVEDPRTAYAKAEYDRIMVEASEFKETTLEETPRYA